MNQRRTPVVRFRHHPGRAIAGLIVTLSATTLIPASGWFALVVLPPLVWTWWAWRAGTDVSARGLRVRALLASRTVPWGQVDHLAAPRSDRVVAVLTNGSVVSLTAVTAADLPRLTAATSADAGPAAASDAGPAAASDAGPATGARRPRWF